MFDATCLVVDGCIVAERVSQQRALLRPARDPDGSAPEVTSNLTDAGTHAARGARHEYRLSRLRPADVDEPEVSRESGHAENAERSREWRDTLVYLVHHVPRRSVGDRVFLPAEFAVHDVANLEIRMPRRDDFADAAPTHRVPDLERFLEACPVEHVHAHDRRERQEQCPYQELAFSGLGYGSFS